MQSNRNYSPVWLLFHQWIRDETCTSRYGCNPIGNQWNRRALVELISERRNDECWGESSMRNPFTFQRTNGCQWKQRTESQPQVAISMINKRNILNSSNKNGILRLKVQAHKWNILNHVHITTFEMAHISGLIKYSSFNNGTLTFSIHNCGRCEQQTETKSAFYFDC